MTPAASLEGTRIGPYRLGRELGRGGMGVVYEAVHGQLGQRAAVKVLPPARAGEPEGRRRLFREARALSVAEDPGLPKIFDCGELPDGTVYLLMELLRGETLRARLRRAPDGLGTGEALRLARQMAATLAHAHAVGVVHRDLKPENVLLVPDEVAPGGERAKIVDFGLARLSGDELSAPGQVRGTPSYMAPEQCAGAGEQDGQVDVYALGALLYELLTGAPPFVGERGDLLRLHLFEDPVPLGQRAKVSAALERLVQRMLAKPRDLRPTMAQVAAALAEEEGAPARALPASRGTTESDEGPAPAPARRGRPRRLLGAAGLIATTAAAALLARRPSAPAATPAVALPGGSFLMGSAPEEIETAYRFGQRLGCTLCARELYEREQPQRLVLLSPYSLDKTEVTNEQFAAWLDRQPGLRVAAGRRVLAGDVLLADLWPDYGYGGLRWQGGHFSARRGHERRPVVLVSWDGARRYCAARGGRLPTEAEWEYAARNLGAQRFPWGDDEPRCDGVVFGRQRGEACAGQGAGPLAVGRAPQDLTPQGVADLGGNVAEWVLDRFRPRYPACPPTPGRPGAACLDPVVTDGGDLRVVRGGAWFRGAEATRAAGRSRQPPAEVTGDIGFRCARGAALPAP